MHSSDCGSPGAPGALALTVPDIVAATGDEAVRRFSEFLATASRSINTRMAYARAVRLFLDWCEAHGFQSLEQIEPRVVATYVDQHSGSTPTVKQHLAAIRTFFDWLASGRVIAANPALSVRGPRYVVTGWKTRALTPQQVRTLLDSIDSESIVGRRDRALIATMVYTFARVSAVVALRIHDYYRHGDCWWVRLRGWGGQPHILPVHRHAVDCLEAYIEAAGLRSAAPAAPLFRSLDRRGYLTESRLTRTDVLRMVKRRGRALGPRSRISCRMLRATGITIYLRNGGSLQNAQAMAAHASPKTTRLYLRDQAPASYRDEIERIDI